MLIALIALSLTAKNDLVKFGCLVVLGFVSTYTGFAIFAGPILLLYFIAETIRSFLYDEYRHRRCIASTAFVLLGVGFSSFFYGYKFQPSNPGFRFPHDPPWEYVVFIAKYWAHFFDLGRSRGFAFTTAVVVTVAFALTLWKYFTLFDKEDSDQRTRICVITFLMLFSMVFSLNLAVGRISFSINQGMASRYLIFMVPFWIACYFLLLGKQRLTGILAASILSILIFYGDQRFQNNSASELRKLAEGKHNWAAAYLEHRDIRKANEASNFKVYPWEWNYDLQEGFIDKMEKEGLGFLKESD